MKSAIRNAHKRVHIFAPDALNNNYDLLFNFVLHLKAAQQLIRLFFDSPSITLPVLNLHRKNKESCQSIYVSSFLQSRRFFYLPVGDRVSWFICFT